MRRAARLLPLLLAGPWLLAGADPPGGSVARDIEEITRPPSYDWLRDPRPPAAGGEEGGGAGSGRSARDGGARRARAEAGEGGCDYEPGPRRAPETGGGNQAADPSRGCGAEAPGASGPVTAPEAEDSAGCAGQRGGGCGAGEDGCGRGPGGCACDRQVGSCACGGVGRVLTPVGYLLGALALGLLVLLVVRAILRRERAGRDSQVDLVAGAASPEEVRVSRVAHVPAETMLDKARAAAARGDYRQAVGWAYLAGLAALHRGGFVDLGISTTNLGIVDETRRRGGPHGPAARLVRIFEDLFFGARAATEDHWRECRRIAEEELGTLPAHRL